MTHIRGRLLDLAYEIVVADEALAAHLRKVYTDSHDDTVEATERFELTRRGQDEFVVLRGGDQLASPTTASRALGALHWHLNRRIVATSRQPVLVHAGTVEVDGHGVLIVGASGAGKTTASAALAMAGFGYLTDDITAVRADGVIVGAAKPVGLRAPSIELLGLERERLQSPPLAYRPGREAQQFVAASSLGARIAPSAEPGMIVFLSPDASPGNAIERRRSRSLARLTEYAFDLGGVGAFEALAELVRRSTCWELGRSTPAEMADFLTKTRGN